MVKPIIENNEPITQSNVVVLNILKMAKNKKMSPLQINKLVYISHGWVLGCCKKSLINNNPHSTSDQIQAWKYGPVVVKTYHQLKKYKNTKINLDDFYQINDIHSDYYYNIELEKLKNNSDVDKLLHWVYAKYSPYSANELINITHKPGTPWHECYKKFSYNIHIPDQIIQKYYESFL